METTSEQRPIATNVKFEGDIPALFSALSAAQAEMGGAKKTSKNPFFKSRYADIAAVLEAALPALSSNNLCLMQFPGWNHEQSMATMTTVLAHSSGGRVTSEAACPVSKVDGPQAYGSIITYMRRYCGQSILAIPAEDDDAEVVQTPYRRTKPVVVVVAPTKPKKVPEPPVEIPSADEHLTEAVELAEQAISLIEASDTVAKLNQQDSLILFDRVQKLDAEEYQRVLSAYRRQKQAIKGGE